MQQHNGISERTVLATQPRSPGPCMGGRPREGAFWVLFRAAYSGRTSCQTPTLAGKIRAAGPPFPPHGHGFLSAPGSLGSALYADLLLQLRRGADGRGAGGRAGAWGPGPCVRPTLARPGAAPGRGRRGRDVISLRPPRSGSPRSRSAAW